MAAHVEKYSISFLVYMNKEAFQSVVEDEMFIHNHDFHRSDELVRAALLSYYFYFVICFNLSFTGYDGHSEYSLPA